MDHIIPVDFTGKLQCDGYAAYRAFANGRNGAIELAGCWAHVRRKFHEALEQSPRTAGWILRQIQHLYRVEARLRGHRAGPALRAAVRAHESRPIVERLERAFIRLKSSGRYLPQSLLGVAMDYALGQWQTLTVFLADGRVEIDNNWCYPARGITPVMPRPGLCRVAKCTAFFPRRISNLEVAGAA
jgi:hypothetical protein